MVFSFVISLTGNPGIEPLRPTVGSTPIKNPMGSSPVNATKTSVPGPGGGKHAPYATDVFSPVIDPLNGDTVLTLVHLCLSSRVSWFPHLSLLTNLTYIACP